MCVCVPFYFYPLLIVTLSSLSLNSGPASVRSLRPDDGEGQGAPLRAPRPAARALHVLRPQEAGIRRGIQVDRAVPRLSGSGERAQKVVSKKIAQYYVLFEDVCTT